MTALVNHCSAEGNCVSNLIKYYELWNEANSSAYWSGTVSQLYQMMAPAVAIIKANVSGAQILSTPISNASGYQSWACSWLSQEVTNGILSNIYAFHTYLSDVIPGDSIHPFVRVSVGAE